MARFRSEQTFFRRAAAAPFASPKLSRSLARSRAVSFVGEFSFSRRRQRNREHSAQRPARPGLGSLAACPSCSSTAPRSRFDQAIRNLFPPAVAGFIALPLLI